MTIGEAEDIIEFMAVFTKSELAQELGISRPTLDKRIIKAKALMEYRAKKDADRVEMLKGKYPYGRLIVVMNKPQGVSKDELFELLITDTDAPEYSSTETEIHVVVEDAKYVYEKLKGADCE